MTNFSQTLRSISLLLLLMTASAGAAEPGFEYPELTVVPRASERIQAEVQLENRNGWRTHLPFLAPASMTLGAGATLLLSGTKKDSEMAPWIGMGVGAAWWAISLGILERERIYLTGVKEIAVMPAKTAREQLLRERRAEETLTRAGRLARRLKFLSFASNAAASVYMISSAENREFSKYFAVGAALTSLTPYFFPHRWEIVDRTQKDYRKRIYGPVAGISWLPTSNGKALAPALTLALQF